MLSTTWILAGPVECAGQPGGGGGLKKPYLIWKGFYFRLKSRTPNPKFVGQARHALPTGGAADRRTPPGQKIAKCVVDLATMFVP